MRVRVRVPVAAIVEVGVDVEIDEEPVQSGDLAGVPLVDFRTLSDDSRQRIVSALTDPSSSPTSHELVQDALWVAAHELVSSGHGVRAHINPWFGLCKDIEVA